MKKVINFRKAARGLIINDKKNSTRRGKEEVSPTVRYYEQLRDKLGKVKCHGKDWYVYNEKQGIWQAKKEESLGPKANEVLAMIDRNPRKITELLTYTRQVSQMAEDEEMHGAVRYDEDPNFFLIKCPTRILKIDIRTGWIVDNLPFSWRYGFTSSIAVDYNPKAVCHLFERTFEEIQPDEEDRELILDFTATALIPHSKFECALICVGEGGNGKGVLWNAITSMLGRENVTDITLSDICHNNRKHVHRMHHALLNVSTETDVRKIMESTVLKQIISGESFATERIYQEGYEMKTTCKQCFNTNNLPNFAGGSNAESRRFRFPHFGRIFSCDKNPNLRDQLDLEREGIFRLLLERLPHVLVGLSEIGYGGRTSRIMHGSFTVRNNPVKAFIDSCLELHPPAGSYELKDSIWSAYKRFAEENSIQFNWEDKDETFKRMYQYKPELRYKQDRKMVNGQQKYIIRGITICYP